MIPIPGRGEAGMVSGDALAAVAGQFAVAIFEKFMPSKPNPNNPILLPGRLRSRFCEIFWEIYRDLLDERAEEARIWEREIFKWNHEAMKRFREKLKRYDEEEKEEAL